jgi:hypothetical protein
VFFFKIHKGSQMIVSVLILLGMVAYWRHVVNKRKSLFKSLGSEIKYVPITEVKFKNTSFVRTSPNQFTEISPKGMPPRIVQVKIAKYHNSVNRGQ